ncbi:hypothetical protein H9L39_09450 [Fusarium oxysporum f. sp. albedinis]|nr:hypothetical protein H9L39_09450 [Fusarium oxysporum f. sp. albedinis]
MVLGGLGQSKRSTRTQDQNIQRTLERWTLESNAMPLPRAIPTNNDRDDRLGYETCEIAQIGSMMRRV